MTRLLSLLLLVPAILLAGCNSYRIVQKNVFSDEDGNLVAICYGIAESDHVSTFVAPATGKEMEFRSKLVVLVDLPDGESLKAWQCMNFSSRGTMYQTDDEKWKILVNGFSCIVYLRDSPDGPDYQTVYRGVLCDSPDIGAKKDDRWRTLRPVSRGMRKNAQPQQ